MWMGEGFVSEIQHNRGREDTMDDVGHRYLRELVQRCMVLVGKMGSLGKIKTCRMHDLMRDFCVSKAQEENFLHINNILSLKLCEVQNNKVRRLAVILESDENYIEGVKFNEYPYLSYRVCCKLELGNLNYLQTLVNVRPKTIQIPTWFKFNLLQVLKVRNKKGAQDAIQMLISRCPLIEKLHLYGHLKKLPEAHQFSPNLAKLTLSGTKLEEDPMETLKKLPNLKILCFRQAFEKISKYESVGRASFNGKNMVCSKGGFPLLQYLFLGTLYYLEEWRVEEGAMPSLCRLEIEFCSRLKMIPDGLRFIATLQELKIIDMPKPFIDSLNEGGPDFDKVKHVHSLVLKSFCQRMIIVSS
uniref:Uncharacterized protein n=1 Tax=Quercus lobata TaxID=97700 RepID=A0A7N2N247_QUELO